MTDPAQEASTTQRGPCRLSDVVEAIDWEKMDELAKEQARENEATEQARRQHDIHVAAQRLWAERGIRYRECTLDSFEATSSEQLRVVKELSQYASNMAIHVRRGAGIVLIGPTGTGKDHLLAAMMDLAIHRELVVKWTSGLRLFRRLRDSIDTGANEAELLRQYTEPGVLVLSDPAWERKPLTDFQQARLGEIVDERWNNKRPIWTSINAEGPADAERLLGAALVDRLRDGALSLACNWGSYRKSVTSLLD